MTDVMEKPFFWCVKHSRVESGDEVCPARRLLGPYRSRDEAEHALERVRQRNEIWDAEDARWGAD
ncbi:MAG: hypothetical protein ACRDT1_09415 [Micromonosporaceae bacterium]